MTLQEFADAVGVKYGRAWQWLAQGKLNPCVDEIAGQSRRDRRFDAHEVSRVREVLRLGLPLRRDTLRGNGHGRFYARPP